MIPKPPPRQPQLGFLYVPPYRVQGISIAGEASAVQVPELDICFDIGDCPRPALAAKFVALSHGHMDHTAALAYWFSQRAFQGLGTGTVICHPKLEAPIQNLMKAWVDIERQRTAYRLIALEPGEETEIKPKTFLRAIPNVHTADSQAYLVLERRHKLKEEYAELDQASLVARKKAGETITRSHDVPLVCYTGDTAWGEHFCREDVLGARILITECTFMEPGDRNRALAGRHLYIEDIARLLTRSRAEAVILTHLSRRTHLSTARQRLERLIPEQEQHRLFLLMDNQGNRRHYEKQLEQAGEPG